MIADEREPDSLETRCSTAIAAKYLGTTRRHVERLVAAGALAAWDVRLPGAKRARWSVLLSSVRLLLTERHRNTRTEDPRTTRTPSPRPAALRS